MSVACVHVAAEAKKHGRVVKIFRFDAAPQINTRSLEKRINERGWAMEVAPRNHHTGVANPLRHLRLFTQKVVYRF